MSEQDIVSQGFNETVATVYKTFFQAYTAAAGDAGAEAQAETRFRDGIAHARHVRDRALASLP